MRSPAAPRQNQPLAASEVETFRANLLVWFDRFQRDLPWRRTRDPYAIWVSEIMLQQTRVAAVIPFYERFLARFPNYAALAEAPEADLLSHWAGLGYYYRVRNLQRAAQAMRESGGFPATHEEIRGLPGIGEYTSAAVASIAFDLPHAALDGNVLRVLSRVLDDATAIGSLNGRRRFAAEADALLDRQRPGAFNQAMMELGATVCLPKNPQCLICPVAELCRGRLAGHERGLPVRLKKAASRKETRRLFWCERDHEVLLWQRPPAARLMPGFWELPEKAQLPAAELGEQIGAFRHGITVHDYTFEIWRATAGSAGEVCRWVPRASFPELPLSTAARKALRVIARLHEPKARVAVQTEAGFPS